MNFDPDPVLVVFMSKHIQTVHNRVVFLTMKVQRQAKTQLKLYLSDPVAMNSCLFMQ